MFDCQRDLFDIPRDVAYLDAAYMSAIPKAAAAAGRVGTDLKARPWKMTIGSFYDEVEEVRSLAASMIGAASDEIAIGAATSYGIAVAAANVAVTPGSNIILMENEHPSHRYIWHELARSKGAKIRIAPRPADGNWTRALVETITSSDAPVSVVAGTMVHWFDGIALDLVAIGEASRAAGASLVVDGTQWVGALPFDVKAVRPDFLSFATYKFLLGPYRLSFLYADKRWHDEGVTLEHHAWNRVGGDKSDFYTVDVPAFLPGARRFDMGQRSDFAVVPVAIEAMKLINGWGLDKVAQRLNHLNELLWSEAGKRGFAVANPDFRTRHIAVIDLGDRMAEGLSAKLKQRDVFVTVRGSNIRVSPHVYNDEQDIMALFKGLDACL